MCHIQHAHVKNNYIKLKNPWVCVVGTYPERGGKSNCKHQEGRLMMIDKHRLYLTPTHDYAVFIYSPVTLSPWALFGLSEEACRRSTRRSCDLYEVILKLTSLSPAFKCSSYCISFIAGQEYEWPRVCELKSETHTRMQALLVWDKVVRKTVKCSPSVNDVVECSLSVFLLINFSETSSGEKCFICLCGVNRASRLQEYGISQQARHFDIFFYLPLTSLVIWNSKCNKDEV